MKGAIFDTMPSLNSNPAKNAFLAACSSPSAAMPAACPSFMKIIPQFQNNFSHPATAMGIFLRELPRINRKLAFSLPHRRLSSVDASITLPSARARFFENYSCPSASCPSASVRSERKFTKKFTGNLREFTFREATPPWTSCRKCFAARGRTTVLIGCVRGFSLQASLQGKDRGGGYRQRNRIIVE